jgi:hypothetical protein
MRLRQAPVGRQVFDDDRGAVAEVAGELEERVEVEHPSPGGASRIEHRFVRVGRRYRPRRWSDDCGERRAAHQWKQVSMSK